MKYYAGLDLGGTFVKCGIVDEEGKIVIKDKIPTGKERPFEAIAADMANFVKELASRAGVEITAAGIGSPGTIDSKNGTIVYANNLGWKKVSLAKEIKKHLGIPVALTNDANAAALGEQFCGAGKAYQSLVLVTLGTGVGAGVVLDGELFEGFRSAGTEIGHEVIRVGGEKCTCGRRGCFEAYSSATALIRQTKRAMEKDPESALWKVAGALDNVDGKTSFDGAELGDRTAKRVVNGYLRYLAEGVANIVNSYRPEAVLLGGGVCAQGDALLLPLRRMVARRAYGGMRYAPVFIGVASLGNDAGLCGAARLAMLKA